MLKIENLDVTTDNKKILKSFNLVISADARPLLTAEAGRAEQM